MSAKPRGLRPAHHVVYVAAFSTCRSSSLSYFVFFCVYLLRSYTVLLGLPMTPGASVTGPPLHLSIYGPKRARWCHSHLSRVWPMRRPLFVHFTPASFMLDKLCTSSVFGFWGFLCLGRLSLPGIVFVLAGSTVNPKR